jgi:ribosomal protein S18
MGWNINPPTGQWKMKQSVCLLKKKKQVPSMKYKKDNHIFVKYITENKVAISQQNKYKPFGHNFSWV